MEKPEIRRGGGEKEKEKKQKYKIVKLHKNKKFLYRTPPILPLIPDSSNSDQKRDKDTDGATLDAAFFYPSFSFDCKF